MQTPEKGVGFSLSSMLSLTDLIKILSIAVSISLAWGAFSTRMALVEHQLVTIREEQIAQSNEVKRTKERTDDLEKNNIETRFAIGELQRKLNVYPSSGVPGANNGNNSYNR